ncbi:DsrE/DsrF/TusD sulfur relay family protein [Burkholderia pseudomallei]|uniref:DsrE/DsrF/TusD sulfur relay family protein n=1 Tax=Burkholderia pseudomallei TaxID=28450 RepID=UPI0005106F37|nr:DsrE family protein [Burkholderia pseudomallei]KGC45618.1 dsrE/DsrF-like family protein [Burkholderia pseudomallei]
MNVLFIINDPPYGTERMYNALRMAATFLKGEAHQVSVFLMADAVLGVKAGQKTPDGYYNVERMLGRVVNGKGEVLLCGTCLDARGIVVSEVMAGARRSSMDKLVVATVAADKVLVF